MSVTDRDKKILLFLVPIVVLAGYWFLLLAPQRKEAEKAGAELAKQEKRRDEAEARVRQLDQAKASFAADYAQLVKLGKAVPSAVDVPSMMVQLESAARGTGIDFTRIAAGERQPAAGSATASGSQPAASGPGQAAQTANGAKDTADAAASKTGVEGSDAKTSTSAKSGGVPVGGGQTGAATAAGGSCAPGLECVPLEFEFRGDFFELADFFHRLKRFVKVANQKLLVRGRLMTVDSLKFSSEEDLFPTLKAEVTATAYLSPKAEGAAAGATAQGPSATTPAGSPPGATPPSGAAPAPTPTATTTP